MEQNALFIRYFWIHCALIFTTQKKAHIILYHQSSLQNPYPKECTLLTENRHRMVFCLEMLILGKQKHDTYSVVMNDLLFCLIMSLSFQIIQGQKKIFICCKTPDNINSTWEIQSINLAIKILPRISLQIKSLLLSQIKSLIIWSRNSERVCPFTATGIIRTFFRFQWKFKGADQK